MFSEYGELPGSSILTISLMMGKTSCEAERLGKPSHAVSHPDRSIVMLGMVNVFAKMEWKLALAADIRDSETSSARQTRHLKGFPISENPSHDQKIRESETSARRAHSALIT
jgi:hypothetical protein